MKGTIKQSQNNFDRNIRLDLLSTNNEFRPVFENILFEDGNAVVTNGYFLIIAPIKEISSLHYETISKIEGKCIHKSHFKELLKCDYITDVTDKHIIELNNGIELHIPFANNPEQFPEYKYLFPIKETEFSEHQIKVNIKYLALICKVFQQYFPTLIFHGDRSPIELRFANRITRGLIMPVI